MPSPSLSPAVQSFAQPPSSPDQAKQLFEQGFSQMAYNVLLGKLPNLAPDVVTFKILDSEADAGNGVGSFVVNRQGLTFYIPVVMAENQIKPLDLLYYKDMNVFLPLSKEWLEQLGKQSVSSMGYGVKPPNTLTTDVDIRNTVVPPTTGRYSYAAEQDAPSPFVSLATEPAPAKLAFLDFIASAPNRVKKAAAQMFETSPRLLKTAAKFYGKTAILDALKYRQEKVADYGHRLSRGGALYVADAKTSPGKFKEIFGADAGIAYQGVLQKGYYAKDDRRDLKRPVKLQPYMDYHEPKDAGAYTLWKADGTRLTALIVANPTDLTNPKASRVPARNIRFIEQSHAPADPMQGGGVNYRMPGKDGYGTRTFVNRFVGVTEDGKLIDTHKLIGSQVSLKELDGSKVFQETVGAPSEKGPKAGQTGFFIARRGSTFSATAPVKVESVTESSDGVKLVRVFGTLGFRTLALSPEHKSGAIIVPSEGLIHIPATYAWIPTKGQLEETELMTSPKDVIRWGTEGLSKTASARVVVKFSNHGFTFGDHSRDGYDFVPALKKLAEDAAISVGDAEDALKQAQELGRCEFYTMDKSAAPQDPQQPPMDPAQAAMGQVEGAPMQPGPQGPSPVDMAVAEQMQSIQAQMQALTQMQQMVQTIQQRAQMIAGGGGAGAAPAAAAAAMGGPMDPSMIGAGAPVQGMGQPQDPSMMQQGQPQQPGMGQDPNAQQQQPPMATMSADDGDINSLAQQVNPQFMEQAGQLNDAGIFDSAALASMAQSPVMRDLVQAYLPNLEKSLDNIGRVLLTLWMDESHVKEELGAETFVSLEDNLRTVFRGLGELILKVNQNALILRGRNESVFQG